MFKYPERYRIQVKGPWPETGPGENGFFEFKSPHGVVRCLAAKGDGWEHVSVSHPHKIPSWEIMVRVRHLFWSDDVTVMQLHPPLADYVDCHPYTLHLWRPEEGEIPRPPNWMV